MEKTTLILGAVLLFGHTFLNAQTSDDQNNGKEPVQRAQTPNDPPPDPPGWTSTSEAEAIETLEIYPNPSAGRVIVQFHLQKAIEVIEVYNLLGIKVMELALGETTIKAKPTLNLAQLPKGYYLIKAGTQSRRLLLQ